MASEHAHKIDGAVRKLRAVMEAFDMKGTNRATMLNAINTINALNTRPAPAATDTALVTIMRRYRGTDWPDRYPWAFLNESDCQSEPGPGWIIEKLCLQSQAEEILATKDAAIKRWRSECERAQSQNVELAEQLAKAEADVSRWHQKAMDAGVITHSDGTTSHPMRKERDDLKADNAAKDARIKDLEDELISLKRWIDVEPIPAVKSLEAKLSAAEKALEPFADIAGVPWADENGWTDAACQNDRIVDWFGPSAFLAARAVLGGKPSC